MANTALRRGVMISLNMLVAISHYLPKNRLGKSELIPQMHNLNLKSFKYNKYVDFTLL